MRKGTRRAGALTLSTKAHTFVACSHNKIAQLRVDTSDLEALRC
jgi:hypothetical protein